MSTNANSVLAELKSIGALGRLKTPALPEPEPEPIPEQGVEPVIDRRAEVTATLLESSVEHLDSAIEALEDMRENLVAMHKLWLGESGAEEDPLVRPEEFKPLSVVAPVPASEPAVEVATAATEPVNEEERLKVLEAVRRKIRGEDLSADEKAKAWAEEEAATPMVGSVRAQPDNAEEITIRTLGAAPSLPTEERENG